VNDEENGGLLAPARASLEVSERLVEVERTGGVCPSWAAKSQSSGPKTKQIIEEPSHGDGEDGEFVPGSRNFGARRGINKRLFGTAQYHVTRSSGRGKRKYRVRSGWVGCLGGISPGAPGVKHESLGLKKLEIDRATSSTPTGKSLTEVNKENGGAIADRPLVEVDGDDGRGIWYPRWAATSQSSSGPKDKVENNRRRSRLVEIGIKFCRAKQIEVRDSKSQISGPKDKADNIGAVSWRWRGRGICSRVSKFRSSTGN
jgi:hypothetical protein